MSLKMSDKNFSQLMRKKGWHYNPIELTYEMFIFDEVVYKITCEMLDQVRDVEGFIDEATQEVKKHFSIKRIL